MPIYLGYEFQKRRVFFIVAIRNSKTCDFILHDIRYVLMLMNKFDIRYVTSYDQFWKYMCLNTI